MNLHTSLLKVCFMTLIYDVIASNIPQTTCDDGTEIPLTSLCDRRADCRDGSDEKHEGRGFRCRIATNKRDCILPQSLLHSGMSICDDKSDVCFDQNDNFLPQSCFQCLNGNQIISLNQVCDGVLNCDDFSDECLCQNIKTPICSQIVYATPETFASNKLTSVDSCKIGEVQCSPPHSNTRSTCLQLYQICDGVENCLHGEDEQYCTKTITCENETATACDGRATCADFSDECKSNCWNKPNYCNQIIDNEYSCHPLFDDLYSNNSYVENVSYNLVCDNVVDCPLDGNDERHCSSSTHFYCFDGSVAFVNQNVRYDGVTDCDDGSDECPSMLPDNVTFFFGHRDEMIPNPIFQVLVWVVATISLLGNTLVMVYTARELWVDRKEQKLGRLAKCNRNFVLNLSIADFMMGLSLFMIGVEGAIMSNNYCSSDREWRSSSVCIIIGMLVQCSSQTSVFILLLMTSYRLYGTLYPFRVEESKLMGVAAAATFTAWLISICIAVIPQTHFAADYFIHQYWFPSPFYNHDLLDHSEMENLLLKIYTLSSNTTRGELKDLHWESMIRFLRNSNLVPMDSSWHNKIIPIGFYNQLPQCQPFFYPTVGDTAWVYMTTIVLFNFLAFVYIGIAYLVIYKNSSRPCVRKSIRKRSKQWRKDNRKMQKKILCLVFTDMACWFPIGFILVLKLSGVSIHPAVHVITGTVLLPINSAVNPLVYSNIFRNFMSRPCRKKSPFERESSSLDPSSLKGSMGSLINVKTLATNSPHITRNNNGKKISQISSSKNQGKSKLQRVRFSSESSSKEIFCENNYKNGMTSQSQIETNKNSLLQNDFNSGKTVTFSCDIGPNETIL